MTKKQLGGVRLLAISLCGTLLGGGVVWGNPEGCVLVERPCENMGVFAHQPGDQVTRESINEWLDLKDWKVADGKALTDENVQEIKNYWDRGTETGQPQDQTFQRLWETYVNAGLIVRKPADDAIYDEIDGGGYLVPVKTPQDEIQRPRRTESAEEMKARLKAEQKEDQEVVKARQKADQVEMEDLLGLAHQLAKNPQTTISSQRKGAYVLKDFLDTWDQGLRNGTSLKDLGTEITERINGSELRTNIVAVEHINSLLGKSNGVLPGGGVFATDAVFDRVKASVEKTDLSPILGVLTCLSKDSSEGVQRRLYNKSVNWLLETPFAVRKKTRQKNFETRFDILQTLQRENKDALSRIVTKNEEQLVGFLSDAYEKLEGQRVSINQFLLAPSLTQKNSLQVKMTKQLGEETAKGFTAAMSNCPSR